MSSNDPNKAALQKLQDDGQQYAAEQATLTAGGAFKYPLTDRLSDLSNGYQLPTRALGAAQGALGTVGAAGALVAGCDSVVACGLGISTAATSLDYAQAGYTQMLSGNPTPTYGEQVLQGLGMSPTGAALTYGGLSLAAGVGSALLPVGVGAATRPADSGIGAKGGVGAVGDTQAALTQQVADLRATLTGNAKTSGNMGVAQIDIPGVQSSMAASSRIETPTAAQQSLGFVGEVPETFPSSVVPTGGNSPYLLNRAADSEAKILNNIAAQLGDNTSMSGTINLLTERAPCASCSNIIQQFQTKYPNIKINVMDNGGVIPPSKKGS